MTVLPRLQGRFDAQAWYTWVRQSGRPVAWCSAFAPAEALLACGIIPVYPEHHAAMLGALCRDAQRQEPWSQATIARARTAGYQGPQLCSYAQADLGSLLAADSPLSGLPEPDLLYSCSSQCAVVARWAEAVRQYFARSQRDLPHFMLRAPPLRRQRYRSSELAPFRSQLAEHLTAIAQRFDSPYDPDRLQEVLAESQRANRLWQDCLQMARRQPAVWANTDAFQAMAAIVIARGDPRATAFYQALHAELADRCRQGLAAVPGERLRLLWDGIPIWPCKNRLAAVAAARRALFVCSTYTHSWDFCFDLQQPWDSMTERYAWNTMNRSPASVFAWTQDLLRSYQAQAVVCHWNRSCGIWNASIKQRLSRYRAAGIPYLLLSADMVDPEAIDEQALCAQLESFIDGLALS